MPSAGRVGDVALDEGHPRALIVGEREAQPRVVGAEVVSDGLLAVVDEGLERPGAEAAERAGHERPRLRQAARPDTP